MGLNENSFTTHPHLQDTMEEVQREKFTALNVLIRKLEESHTSNLKPHLKALLQKEVNTPKRS